MTMRVRKGNRSWWKEIIWRVTTSFGVESFGCGLLKLGFLENVETKED